MTEEDKENKNQQRILRIIKRMKILNKKQVKKPLSRKNLSKKKKEAASEKLSSAKEIQAQLLANLERQE